MTIYTDLKADISNMWSISLTDIPDEFMVRSVKWVQSEIDKYGFALTDYPTNTWKPTHYQLYEAALWFAAELLSQRGIINQNVGEVASERLGRLEIKYANKQPIFFFFGKTMKSLDYERLLSHETFRTLAYSFIEMFYLSYMKGDIRRYPAEFRINTDSEWSSDWE